MVACVALLQKPHTKSKSRDCVTVLGCRLRAWHAGDIEGLLREGRTTRQVLHANRPTALILNRTMEKVPQGFFSRLVLAGKVHAAIRYLSENERTVFLSLDDLCGAQTVREVLVENHPASGPVEREALQSPNEFTTQPVQPRFLRSNYWRCHQNVRTRNSRISRTA